MSAVVGVAELVLVRHGESTGNVAWAQAYAAGSETIDIAVRDPDVPLSELGREQATDLGRALADNPPDAVWSSPYRRARETAEIGLANAGLDRTVRLDERLRDRELGILDRLTGSGIRARYPVEAERRARWGKFYHRPPGGESWADVALRLRSVLPEILAADHARVLVVCHDNVVLLTRYILEGLDEQTVLNIGRENAVANASVTRLARDGAGWRLMSFNDIAHLHAGERTDYPAKTDA